MKNANFSQIKLKNLIIWLSKKSFKVCINRNRQRDL